jgi:putative membrane protein
MLKWIMVGVVIVGAWWTDAAAEVTPTPLPTEGRSGGNLPTVDRNFIMAAAPAGLAEVELSRSVRDRLTSQDVKDFADRMIIDHGKANTQLTTIAQRKGVTPPNQMDQAHMNLKRTLASLSGAELERRYMDSMVTDHEKAVSLFENEVRQGQDPDLKKFAQDTLPTLREHLNSARTIDQRLKKIQ